MTAADRLPAAPRVRTSSPRLAAAVPLFLILLAIAMLGIGAALAPGFASAANLLQLLKIASFLGLVALGQTLVMLVGGIDLSVAWVLTGSAVVFTALCAGQDANTATACLAALAVGIAAGAANGFGIVKLRISPIVMTLAMNNIALGGTLVFTGGTPSGGVSPLVRGIATGGVGGIPYMVIVWGLVATLAIVAIRYSRWGRRLLAVGENATVAHLNGIANDRVTIGAYVLCGALASATGILFAAFSGSSFLGMGDQFVLPAIAAVVLGGTSMFGGRGGYGGTFAAVIFTTVLSTVLVIGNIPAGVRSIIFGVAILVALVAQRVLTRGEDRE
ncbi:ABC transporter permease [Kaistia sp. 32K]|uniref:ABC transporter permease n=1 Tax=Kaistia sp. 32K TaxID=2795690 RepID=UPI001914EE4B|nr:ABC transporter permease [Kaistia sp. 32K]BCP52407.1 ABC transporter permease [Kaistia sp. 32K]